MLYFLLFGDGCIHHKAAGITQSRYVMQAVTATVYATLPDDAVPGEYLYIDDRVMPNPDYTSVAVDIEATDKLDQLIDGLSTATTISQIRSRAAMLKDGVDG